MKSYEIPFQKEFNAYLKTTNPQTYRYYNKEIFYFLSWVNKYIHVDHKALYDVSMSQIQRYIHEQIQKNKEIKTINKKITIIKAYYDFLWHINILSPDPAAKIKRIQAESIEKDTAFLDKEQLEKISTFLLHKQRFSLRDMAIYSLFLFAGLKLSEFMQIESKHLVFNSEGLFIEVVGSSTRVVRLPKEEAKYLEQYMQSIPKEQSYLFVSSNGNKLGTSSVNYIFAEAKKCTGVDVNPRKLRNTCGMMKLKSGWSNEMISDYLGIDYFIHAKR